MVGTADLNMINLQVYAQQEAAAAEANGTYAARRAADRKAFLWQSSHQTIPMGTETDPAGFARALRQALPLVNALRIPFNRYSFNPDGTLDPRFEAFLDEAARQGFEILFVYMDGEGQRYGSAAVPGTAKASAAEIAAALKGEVLDRAKQSFGLLLDWLSRHPGVQAKTWGLELMNEPAAFKTGMDRLPKTDADGRAGFVALYAEVMADLARSIQPRWTGPILVGGFAYSADFPILAETRMPVGGITALDYVRRAVGAQLVWSAHLYPGWRGTGKARTGADLSRALDAQFGVLGTDRILLTETNAPEAKTYSLLARSEPAELFAQNYEWFADRGIGIAWFPGAQTGNSSFLTYTPGQPLLFEHLDSYGAGMNAFTLGASPAGPGRRIVPGLIAGIVTLDRDTPAAFLRGEPANGAAGIAVAAGGTGDDTIDGIAGADNFLYGGPGEDRVTGAGRNDYLYGQDGNDTIVNPSGDDHLFGGRGNDLLVNLGLGYSTLWGGPGGDRFSIGTRSKTVIADYAPENGDTTDFRGRYASLDEVLRRTAVIDYDGNGIPDLMVWHDDGGYTIFLDMGDRLLEFARSLAEFRPPAGLPAIPAAEIITGAPFSPATGANPDGPPVPPEPVPPAVELPPGPGRGLHAASGIEPTLGTQGDDRIEGRGDGVIIAGPGDDLVTDKRGGDTIFAGDGNDTIETGRRGSEIITGSGDDQVRIDMRSGGSRIWAGPGRDRFDITDVGDLTRPDRHVDAQVFGFDPAQDTILYQGHPVDLTNLPPGLTVTRFGSGEVLGVGSARLYLYPPGASALPAGDDPAELSFDPRFDPADPARHLP